MEEGDFNQLLADISKWYDAQGSIGMLKVLYKDHLTSNKLDSATSTRSLLDSLYEAGILTPSDPTIIFETVKVTKQYGLILPLCPHIRDIPIVKFTSYRQSIIKFGNTLTTKNVEQISGLFNTPVKMYSNGWYLISDLESRKELCKQNIVAFIDKMRRNALPYPEPFQQQIQAKQKSVRGNKEQRRKQPNGTTGQKESTGFNIKKITKHDYSNTQLYKTSNENKLIVQNYNYSNEKPKKDKIGHKHVNKPRVTGHRLRNLVCRITISVIVICVLMGIVLPLIMLNQSSTDQNGCINNLIIGEANKTMIDFSNMNFTGVCGKDLSELYVVFPDITYFKMYNCSLTGQTIADMINECDKQGIILKDGILGLNGNNLSDIDSASFTKLPRLIKRFSKTSALKWTDYDFTAENLQDLINACDDNCNFNWTNVDLSKVDLSLIRGETLAKIFNFFPNITYLNLYQCNLSGDTIRDMFIECEKQGIIFNEIIGIWGNDLSGITSNSLVKLLHVLKSFDKNMILKWTDFKLTVKHLRDLVKTCDEINCTFKWTKLDIGKVDLSLISGKTLAKIVRLFPNMTYLDLYQCHLSGKIISDMVVEFEKNGMVLNEVLGLWNNDISDIPGISFAKLIPMLKRYDSKTTLNWKNYKFTAMNLHDLITVCSNNCSFNVTKLDLSNTNLIKLDGFLVANIFIIFPNLLYLDMRECSLTDTFLNDFLTECNNRNIDLAGKVINVIGNELNDPLRDSLANVWM